MEHGVKDNMFFKKGNIPWNKGKKGVQKMSEETRLKMSNSQRGKKRKPMSDIGRKNISNANIGKHLSEEHKKKIGLKILGKKRLDVTGQNHPFWKGDNVGYYTLHDWVNFHLGRPTTCTLCGKKNLTGHFIHWANKSGEYKRDLTDWIRLCSNCHKNYDGKHKAGLLDVGSRFSNEIRKKLNSRTV